MTDILINYLLKKIIEDGVIDAGILKSKNLLDKAVDELK
jgi:hypothetical protein